MLPEFFANMNNCKVHILCGYDLLAQSIYDSLSNLEIRAQISSSMGVLNLEKETIHLLIVDNAASQEESIEQLLHYCVNKLPSTKVIIIDTTCNPHRILLAYNLGVEGYFYLGDQLIPRFNRAIIDILDGGTYYSPSITAALINARHLTENIFPRLNEYHYGVLQGMADHLTGTKIAERLDRSTHAIYQVQRYLRGLFNVETNSELLDAALSWGIIRRP